MTASPFDPRDLPETSEMLEAWEHAIKLGIRTHVPATVVAYDPATQTVTATADHRLVTRVKSPDAMPAGAELVGAFPNAKAVLPPKLLKDIPVIFPGSGSAYLTWPILPGSTGTLHVHDRDIGAWRLKGVPTDPVFAWTHILEAAEFHPGLRPISGAITPATDLTATVLEGPLVKIGRLAAEALVKADTLIAVIDAAWAAATPTATDGGAGLKTTWLSSWNGAKATIKSTKGFTE